MSEPVTIAVVGAGNRGAAYARRAVEGARARVVAVAEPDRRRRRAMTARHDIDDDASYSDWTELAAAPRRADAVVIATQDTMHVEPAVALAEAGYHVLLEKPMATTAGGARAIVEAARRSNVLLAVCHVLRYTPYTQALRRVITEGRIGDVVSVEHLEPVGWWHQAHSYVRGHWRREQDSSPMLLAKSVHDLDWLNHIIGCRPRRVASFGSLFHFRAEHRPDGAGTTCLECAVEPDCPYSAPKLYLSCLGDARREEWPLSTVTDARDPAGVLEALRTGPYGRCVYDCDNDVVDHQVVSIEYERGVTASFTMTAFTPHMGRKTRVFGTHGYVEGDGARISLRDFRSNEHHEISTATGDDATAGGHGGADQNLVDAFVRAVADGGRSDVLAPPEESYASHELVWAAERARTTGTVIDIADSVRDPAVHLIPRS